MSDVLIHPTAIIDSGASIGSNVRIGPGAIIGADVVIDNDCEIGPYSIIKGPTNIGQKTHIFQFCSIGEDPQDKKFQEGGESRLVIGENNTIREYCSLNRGTEQGGGITRLGDDNWLMAYVHVAHDCLVGSHNIFANNATLAGHVVIEDFVILGGFTGVHQFCRMGMHSFSAISSGVVKDVPPYVMVSGSPAKPHGLNREGLKRRGFTPEELNRLKIAYRLLYRNQLTLNDAIIELEKLSVECDKVTCLLEFVREPGRGIVR